METGSELADQRPAGPFGITILPLQMMDERQRNEFGCRRGDDAFERGVFRPAVIAAADL
jgi:hypothetical protein